MNGASCAEGALSEASALRDRTVQTSYLGYGHWKNPSFQVQAGEQLACKACKACKACEACEA